MNDVENKMVIDGWWNDEPKGKSLFRVRGILTSKFEVSLAASNPEEAEKIVKEHIPEAYLLECRRGEPEVEIDEIDIE